MANQESSSSLYKNVSGSTLSLADKVRALHTVGDVDGVFALFDSVPTPPTTTLCCVNPSTSLIELVASNLHSVLPVGGSVLSIGSGSGLFEHLLNHKLVGTSTQVIGIDVAPINVFLQSESFYCVRTDQDPSTIVMENIHVLLSVYLRRPSLLLDYISFFSSVSAVVLIGPRSEDPFQEKVVAQQLESSGWTQTVIDSPSLARWDILQILKKK
ncbi:hypothetical protein BCR33DRAFT_718043 [Rhizoclosmatium globosum]|uniref:Methyltransferase domain-containing protein n=1 Tax=Rhizoclosmatium globosum TaxID=329046 RepID=A0A1Y2C721_9FUNG|nr:hypothetical protein BCR33DRAFT_718043 [Rhizoclosmatium globosum]|eukprot:ORY42829.1 hypothetical protein BCR33DRAFT_718043 [Rhizoclosmatium globosum]